MLSNGLLEQKILLQDLQPIKRRTDCLLKEYYYDLTYNKNLMVKLVK